MRTHGNSGSTAFAADMEIGSFLLHNFPVDSLSIRVRSHVLSMGDGKMAPRRVIFWSFVSIRRYKLGMG